MHRTHPEIEKKLKTQILTAHINEKYRFEQKYSTNFTTNVMKSDIAAEKYNIISYDTNGSKYESSSPKLLGKTLLIMPQI